jgi:hypothetical protein
MAVIYGLGFWLASVAGLVVLAGVVMKRWPNGK